MLVWVLLRGLSAERSASSSSATRRSSGVVTLRFSGGDRVDQDRAARRLDQHRLVGRRVAAARSAASASRSASVRKTCGVCAAQSATRSTVASTTSARICPLSRAKCASRLDGPLDRVGDRGGGDHAGGLGVRVEVGDQRFDQLRRQQRPRRVVDRDAARSPPPPARWRPTRARVAPPATTPRSSAAEVADVARRARRRRSSAPTSHARKASIDHSTIGLPATGTKAFGPPAPSRSPEPAAAMTAVTDATAATRWRRSAPPAGRRGIPPRPPRPCRART